MAPWHKSDIAARAITICKSASLAGINCKAVVQGGFLTQVSSFILRMDRSIYWAAWWWGGKHCHLTARSFLVRLSAMAFWVSLHVFPVHSWVSSRWFGFLPQSKNKWTVNKVKSCISSDEQKPLTYWRVLLFILQKQSPTCRSSVWETKYTHVIHIVCISLYHINLGKIFS